MVYNRRDLKVVSIIQLLMTAIFFILGLVDRFKVRYLYTSFLLSPCWTAALVLPIGIMGLFLSSRSRRPSHLIYALKSVSMACVAMSAATMYHYQWGIGILLAQKGPSFTYIKEKDTKFKFTDEENTMLAISSLAILFSIIEMILAFASAKSCGDTGYEPPRENQGLHLYNQSFAGQTPLQQLQPTYIAAQPVAVGQPIVAGQPMVAGQPVVAGQPMVAGQPVDAGQPVVAGQPMVAGQQMIAAQQMVAGQTVVSSKPVVAIP